MLPFVVPFFHEHDFVLLLLPALYCAIHARGTDARICCVGEHIVRRRLARPGTTAERRAAEHRCSQPRARSDSRLLAHMRRVAFAGLIVPLAVIAVSLIARTHPVPIWPDALPAGWHGPRRCERQRAMGTRTTRRRARTQDPVWAFLRLLSLISDALLGFALYRCLLDVDVHEVVERREGVRVEAG